MLDLILPAKVPDNRNDYLESDLGAFSIYTLVGLGPDGIHGLKTALVNGHAKATNDPGPLPSEYIHIPPRYDFSGYRLRDIYNYHLDRRDAARGQTELHPRDRIDQTLFFVAYSPNYEQDGVLLVNLDIDGESSISTCPVELSHAILDAVNLQIANEGWDDMKGPWLPVHGSTVLPSMIGDMHELWGGHARAKLPPDYLNASEIRPVPDHQEIFINNDRSDLEARNSLIISLCEEVTDPSKTNHGALIYHILDQLDEDGPCLGLGETVQRTMATFPGAPVVTTQTISKPQPLPDGTFNFVVQYFLLLRIAVKHTDVLVTVNVPCVGFSEDAIANDPLTNANDRHLAQGRQMMENFMETFEVVDWSFLG